MTKIRSGRRNRSRGRTAISRRRIGYGIRKPKGNSSRERSIRISRKRRLSKREQGFIEHSITSNVNLIASRIKTNVAL